MNLIDTEDDDDIIPILAMVAVYHHNAMRRRTFLRRAAILPSDQSPWRHLLESGDENSFLTLTGFDHHAFEEIA